ncbi:uncharacterized protein LOC115219465 [Argonauta hians]
MDPNEIELHIDDVPLTSSLFRLNWISDDSDSNDEDKASSAADHDSRRQLADDKENSGIESPHDNDADKKQGAIAPSSEHLSINEQGQDRRQGKKRPITTQTSLSPGIHVKNAGVVDVSPKLALKKKTKDDPFNTLEKMAAMLLSVEEMKLVMHYMYEYKKNNDIETLVKHLYDILDTDFKRKLFLQIRETISPFDTEKFDAILSSLHTMETSKPQPKKQLLESDNAERPLLKEVQFRRRQLELQLEMSEQMKKVRPKHYKRCGDEELENSTTVYVSKNNPTLGISVTRGSDPDNPVLIANVHPEGAAAQTQSIFPGMTLISVDDEDIRGVSHQAAVFLIRKAFCCHKRPYLKLVLGKPCSSSDTNGTTPKE